ncbi:PREDICTED: rho-related GTP-binding protein RhoU-like isoform X2 [Poecilia mexicana]|uniref:rho-related GTP-binding protein RhoU-like isoform X2 n=1 Tax=Poecilia mexicana TaxID=48701 RepID=UPI00072E5B62|nr:PREDICTED: rho-related GTP-binding protein RhoU-like isoform X2 [Poecilia mexicana]
MAAVRKQVGSVFGSEDSSKLGWFHWKALEVQMVFCSVSLLRRTTMTDVGNANQLLPLRRETSVCFTPLTHFTVNPLTDLLLPTQASTELREEDGAARLNRALFRTKSIERGMLPLDVGNQKPCRVSEPFDGGDRPTVPPRRLKNRDFPQSAKRRWSGSTPERKVNCVLVGDGAVGKTSLIVSYTTNGYPTEYVPTAFDNFTVMVVVDGKPVRLQLCDTAGQKWGPVDGSVNDELESLRPLCYRNADVFLLCYSVVRPCSFRNLTNKWTPEIQQLCPGVPLVLVGTQLDLREDVQVLIHLAQNQQRPVSTEEGRRLALELGAVGFTECSALTQKNLKDTFDGAILASFQQMDSNVVQQQRMTLRKKTPDKIKSLSEAWWKKLNCLIAEGSCELK